MLVSFLPGATYLPALESGVFILWMDDETKADPETMDPFKASWKFLTSVSKYKPHPTLLKTAENRGSMNKESPQNHTPCQDVS